METKVRSPAVHLESPRLVVREIQRNDLQQMETWQSFSDPLHRLWNIPRRTSLSREIRFMLHSSDPTKLWFAVQRRPDKRVIGTISLREIVMYESARLGISLGADYVEQGYGSEALRLFLPYYFDDLGFQRLFLDVAATNRRAIHVYEKLGFQQTDRHYRSIPDQEDLSFLKEEPYRHLRVYFRQRFGHMQLQFYDMILERREWQKQLGQPARSSRTEL